MNVPEFEQTRGEEGRYNITEMVRAPEDGESQRQFVFRIKVGQVKNNVRNKPAWSWSATLGKT